MTLDRAGVLMLAFALLFERSGFPVLFLVCLGLAFAAVFLGALLSLGELLEPAAMRWLERRERRRRAAFLNGEGRPKVEDILKAAKRAMNE